MSQQTSTRTLTGTRIRERRLALSRRQADVARAAGISPAYLNLIEHNRRAIGDALVARLAEVLEVPADELAEGREEARLTALREAAARLQEGRAEDRGTPPEIQLAPEFLARFPGWSDALIQASRRAEGLERQLVSLSDRMREDPYLLTTLHAILSAVTSVRSTASILADEQDVPAEWLRRFHANLDEDSKRLSLTAQALVAYLDSFEAESAMVTPREELEAWLGAGMPEIETAADLVSDNAREMARAHRAELARDRQTLPDQHLTSAVETSRDPVALAARFSLPLDLILRRLVDLRPLGFENAGLIICDGSGALIFRRPAPGFPLPRTGDSCPLWPVFQALCLPHTALLHLVETPEGRQFRCLSYASRSQPLGIDGPILGRATMLIQPADEPAGQVIEIGPACRICPRPDCPARREPSILAAG